MPILFQTLLSDAGLDLSEVKILRHTPSGRVNLHAVWRQDRSAYEQYQSIQLQKFRNQFVRPYWASCIGFPDGRTLFAGVYRARLTGPVPAGMTDSLSRLPLSPSTHDLYEAVPTSELDEYSGKLFIGWSGRQWKQNGDSGPHPVVALLDTIRDPEFPGLLEFAKPLSEILYLPEGWRSHLSNARGVYLLTCPKTKEAYVGKADGADGFLGRWINYAANGHGGNVRLKSRDPSDYQVSILEVAGSAVTSNEVGAMEERWKRKLQSREMGLNAN